MGLPGVLESDTLWPDPANQQLAAFAQGRAWHPTGSGANQAYQTAHGSQPTTAEGPMQPHREHPWSI